MIKHFYFYALTCGVPEARYRSFFPIAYSCLPIMVTKELEHGPDHPKKSQRKVPQPTQTPMPGMCFLHCSHLEVPVGQPVPHGHDFLY